MGFSSTSEEETDNEDVVVPALTHSDPPHSDWKVPAGQKMQRAVRSPGACVPGKHGSGSVAPVAHEWPGGQGRHSAALVRSVALE